MDGKAFVEQLKAENEKLLSKLDVAPAIGAQAGGAAGLAALLKMALKNEIEAAEIAAEWVATTPELEAKLALARSEERRVGKECRL